MSILGRTGQILKSALRLGNVEDVPEGSRHIQLRDTLAGGVVTRLKGLTPPQLMVLGLRDGGGKGSEWSLFVADLGDEGLCLLLTEDQKAGLTWCTKTLAPTLIPGRERIILNKQIRGRK